ncbi:MAG: glycosyl hydrolase-related protein [Spirochaetales bacterium]|nr:glycosyl hydrolase-related protein [Spirochaetales bacterium]
MLQRAHDFNSPLLAYPGRKGECANGTSLFFSHEDGVKIDTVKPAEDGRGVILRCYETQGGTVDTAIESSQEFQVVEETNLLEQKVGDLAWEDGVKLQFSPYEIRTFRLV